jgi:hypothetical protein
MHASSLGTQTLTQTIDIALGSADPAQQFHIAHTDRVRDRDRLFVDIQPDVYRVSCSMLASVVEIAGCGLVHTVRLWQQC